MAEVLEQKILRDGAVVLIETYPIDDELCIMMKRPPGSREIVIGLQTREGIYTYTPPQVSKYLTKNHYRRLFNAIRSCTGFEKVHYFLLHEIKTKKDVKKLDGFVHRLLSV